MVMKTLKTAFILLLLPLSALSAGNPLGLGQPSFPEAPPFWLQIENDSLGLEVDGEWDDKSSFGLKSGAGFLDGRLMSVFSYTGFTDRGDRDDPPLRFDRMDFGFAWRPGAFSMGDWELDLIPGGGMLLLGELGGYEIQSWWHDLVHVERPIPGEGCYVKGERGSVDAEAYAFAEMHISSLSLPWLHFDSALRMETTGWLFFNAGVSAGRKLREKTQLVSLHYQDDLFSFDESPFPPTLVRDGVRVALELRAGGLYVEKGTAVFQDRIDGSMGFLLGGLSSEELPASGKAERMDAGTSAFLNGPMIRWAWELNSLGLDMLEYERWWMMIQYQSGWRVMDGKYDDKAKRFSSFSIGLEYHLFLKRLPLLGPYAALGAGLSDFRELEGGLEEAKTTENEVFFHMSPHLGLRIDLPSKGSPFTYSFALEGGLMFKLNDDPGVHPVVNFIVGCRLY